MFDLRIQEFGFFGTFPHYQRKSSGMLHLLSVQFDKDGFERFVVELGVLPLGDFETSWGEVVAEDRLDVAYVGFESRFRLGTSEDRSDYWFVLTEANAEEIMCEVERFFRGDGEAFYRKKS